MTEPAAEANRERPGLAEAFDWRAGRTWALFATASLCFGGVLGLCCVALEGLVFLLFAKEPPEGKAFVTLLLGTCLVIGAWPIVNRFRIGNPKAGLFDIPDLEPQRDKSFWTKRPMAAVLRVLWPLFCLASAWVASGLATLPFSGDFFSGVSLFLALLLMFETFDLPFWVIDRWSQKDRGASSD